eukprot:TRINITY_DN12171_c0_g2_i2.p2 TRINITY_DN12171_c0_g2~~TRINITY_DN12171_c0_g2_i2.p2  ORF type:complete len:212 (-),score=25.61 TRINITY_DN12171_c0_g2_i2:235-870(-)
MHRKGKKRGAGKTFTKGDFFSCKYNTCSQPTNNTIKNCPRCKSRYSLDFFKKSSDAFKQHRLLKTQLNIDTQQFANQNDKIHLKSFCCCDNFCSNERAFYFYMWGDNKQETYKHFHKWLQNEIMDANNDEDFGENEDYYRQYFDPCDADTNLQASLLNLSDFVIRNKKQCNKQKGDAEYFVQQKNSKFLKDEYDGWELTSEKSSFSFEMVE